MSKNVTLPAFDPTGELSPLVLNAIKDGATCDHDPKAVGERIIVSFKTEKDAEAFRKALPKAPEPTPATEDISAAD